MTFQKLYEKRGQTLELKVIELGKILPIIEQERQTSQIRTAKCKDAEGEEYSIPLWGEHQCHQLEVGDKFTTIPPQDGAPFYIIKNIAPTIKKYVITGSPGSGKTSIIRYLELRLGEHVIREAAEDVIALEQALGNKEPWKNPLDLQQKILNGQLLRAERTPPQAKRVFIDRDVPDGLAYIEKCALHTEILEIAKKKHYEKIFILAPLQNLEKNSVRHENREEATRLGKKLEQVYKRLGYKPIKIPASSLEKRVKKIMTHLT